MALNLELHTSRLVLRPLGDDIGDAKALWPYVSDPNIPRFMTWDAHRSIDETQSFVDAMKQSNAGWRGEAGGQNIVWAICYKGAPVGVIGLHDITKIMRAWRMDRAELGYWLGPPFQNLGLITEAAKEVLRFGYQSLGLHKIIVGCIVDNAPSRRVIEKLGFRLLGEQRDHMFRFGRWWNHCSYELCVDEWQELQHKM